MSTPTDQDATHLLNLMAGGDAAAAERLLPLVYSEMQELARKCFARERVSHTLQPTILVHEAYMRLIGQERLKFNSRSHFMAIAAKAMRQALIDHARAHNAAKRAGGKCRITLDDIDAPDKNQPDTDVLALHEALEKLAAHDERKARVVELRYFGGMSMEEVADVLGVSRTTIADDWRVARAWLAREMDQSSNS